MSGAPAALGGLAGAMPVLTRRFGAAHGVLYRRSGGRRVARWFGAPVLLLETVGRRTGVPRFAPVVYLRDGDDLVVVPANAGAGVPAWWLNLRAAGRAVVHLGGERRVVRPVELAGAERDRAWRRHAAVTPVDRYARRAGRALPVIALRPVDRAAPADCHETLKLAPYNRLSFNLS